jgi:ATP-dependent RNA helicase DeaD
MVTPREKRLLRSIESLIRQPLKRTALPTAEDVKAHREDELLASVKVWLGRARFKREHELVERLVAEGHDPLDIAAAALKLARAEEKQRPLAPLAEVQDTAVRRGEREGRQAPLRGSVEGSKVSHEPGMVRLSLSKGRLHGVRPNDVVGTIAFHADIPGSTIGKIFIQDKYTLVDVPEKFVGRVLAKTGDYRIRQHAVSVELA